MENMASKLATEPYEEPGRTVFTGWRVVTPGECGEIDSHAPGCPWLDETITCSICDAECSGHA